MAYFDEDDEFDNFNWETAEKKLSNKEEGIIKKSTEGVSMENNNHVNKEGINIDNNEDEEFDNFNWDEIEKIGSAKKVAKVKENEEIRKNNIVENSEMEAPIWMKEEEKGETEMMESNLKNDKVEINTEKENKVEEELKEELTKALLEYFGYSELREGQFEVMLNIMNKRDSLVLWCTGKGKSLCYQLPLLSSRMEGKVAIIVSPLISLMKDQSMQLNAKVGRFASCVLGSSQTDPQVEIDAIDGKYKFVYVTPEKITSSAFASKLAILYPKLAFVAVDESHCISEWGNDYRPSFLELGLIRSSLVGIPFMALTATATKRVVEDIKNNLKMIEPYESISSLDRENLELTVVVKEGFDKDIRKIANMLMEGGTIKSTIIYCYSRALVEKVYSSIKFILNQKFPDVKIESYHAGIDSNTKDLNHKNFIMGKVKVLVATIAFGMGIDKGDIRNVIHYGPSKTMESYLQEIGRAGRDGLTSQCLLFYSSGDFSVYKSDFYTKNMEETNPIAAKAAAVSLDFHQSYCLDTTNCRRKRILDFFNQTAEFNICGNCDVCKKKERVGSDLERDFSREAAIILQVVDDHENRPPAMTKLTTFISESLTKLNILQDRVTTPLKDMRMKDFKSDPIRKAFISSLVSKNLLKIVSKKTEVSSGSGFNKFNKAYDVFLVTAEGKKFLRSIDLHNRYQSSSRPPFVPVYLPVPNLIREREETLKKQRKQLAIELKREIPNDKEEGGEAVNMCVQWSNYLKSKRQRGSEKAAAEEEDILRQVLLWRDNEASKLEISPSVIFPDYIGMKIVYTGAKTESDIKSCGVRLASSLSGLEALLMKLRPTTIASSSSLPASAIIFPFLPSSFLSPTPYEHAIYKTNKKASLAAWESSAIEFNNGKSIIEIANNRSDGKVLKPATIWGHILTSLLFGKYAINLKRLAIEMTKVEADVLPTKEQWEMLEHAMTMNGKPVNDPDFIAQANNLLKHVPEVSLAYTTDFTLRSDKDKIMLNPWYTKVRFFVHLKAAGVNVNFDKIIEDNDDDDDEKKEGKKGEKRKRDDDGDNDEGLYLGLVNKKFKSSNSSLEKKPNQLFL